VSDKRDLLLEFGCEEIPSGFIKGALKRIEELFKEFFEQNRIGFGGLELLATPRRLTLLARDVDSVQASQTLEIKGPPKRISVDEDGNFTKAAVKFAEGKGGSLEQVEIRATDKGEYLYLVVHEEGKATADSLKELPGFIIEKVVFPKSMRWDVRSIRFARPIRWIGMMFGNEAVEVDYQGVPSGAFTFVNRYYNSERVCYESIDDYFEKLENSGVIVDQNKRQETIREGVLAAAEGRPHITDKLLNDVNYLIEYPYIGVGSFPEEFTNLPPEVLIICIEKNQYYFPIADPETGKMLPRFVVVMNVPLGNDRVVIGGYEKVLISRLKDAAFFYDEDLRTKLADRVESLDRITFHVKLGSLLDKTKRVQKLVATIASKTGVEGDDVVAAERAALLMKADLTTHMVFEYTEIQGTVGRIYALESGESEQVAKAIEEHYMPRFADDELPETKAGALLALADKLDTITGYFSLGLSPTGSADPYQLRRQAIGVLRILDGFDIQVSPGELFDLTIDSYPGDSAPVTGRESLKEELFDFFKGRFGNLLEAEGFNYDVVNALDLRRVSSISAARGAAEAIRELRDEKDFDDLREVYTRISNILSKSAKDMDCSDNKVDESLFETEEEKNLYGMAAKLEKSVDDESKSYRDKIIELYALSQPANLFFDNVMVMAENPQIRSNRIGILLFVQNVYMKIADFREIVKKQ